MRFLRWVLFGTVFVTACEPAWVLGVEEQVSEKNHLEEPPPIADDDITTKHPVYDPALVTHEQIDGCDVALNKSGSITKLDILPYDDASKDLDGKIFPTFVVAVNALGAKRPVLPSMELVQALLKPFDDGLYAAVELSAEHGTDGAAVDKVSAFNALAGALAARSNAAATTSAAWFAGALNEAGETASGPSDVLSQATAMQSQFESQPLAASPIGFYTWTPLLGSVFRQDRFLQGKWSKGPSFESVVEVAQAIRGDTALRDRYSRVLDLYAGLSNPYRDVSPLAVAQLLDGGAPSDAAGLLAAVNEKYPQLTQAGQCAAQFSMLPPSDSAENRLFRALYCSGGLSADQNLLDVLIARIRSGELDLTPGPDAGWYDRQTYALETLLAPERAEEKDHLFLTRRYKEKLIETFKTLITQNRETHAKEIDVGSSGTSAAIGPRYFDLRPNLPAEPFATFYVRTARAYAFVETLLASTMGKDWLAQAHRLREDGLYVVTPIGEELAQVKTLLYGLYLLSSEAIGSKPQLAPEENVDVASAKQRAQTFLQSYATNVDVARDPRVITPVFVDLDHGETHYWAVVGVQVMKMRAEFYPGFEPKDVLPEPGCVLRDTVPEEKFLLVGKTIEVVLPSSTPPPTRDQFRKACDTGVTVDGIRAALGAR